MASIHVVQQSLRHSALHMKRCPRPSSLSFFITQTPYEPSTAPPCTQARPMRSAKRDCTMWSRCTMKANVARGKKLLTKRPAFPSSTRFLSSGEDGTWAPRSDPTGLSEGSFALKFADFRDTLNTLVTESIGMDDMREVEDGDNMFVSQSGRSLMFPWRKWTDAASKVDDGVTEKVKKRKHPSVTTILQKTMSPESTMALLKWEKYMIKKMGFPAFQKFKQEMFAQGHQLHDTIGNVLVNRSEQLDIGDGIKGYWESIKDRLLELASDSPSLECHTTHPFLGYHGYADCVTLYQGEPCVVEFKTSRKPKDTLCKCFDQPVQLAAYLGALNFDSRYKLKIEKAVLAIAYKDGSPASLHVLDSALCDEYWKKWLRRLQKYRDLERRQVAREAVN